jgi:glycosyltransferase involved in cell wall biosynthesis
MRVLMISKACVVGAYQRKLEEIAACPGIDLVVAVPPAWRDERGELRLERTYTHGYDLLVEPLLFNGHFHLHFYPRLGRLFARLRPDVVHIDEEPYNFATWHALRLARRYKAKSVFFSWQNLQRRYPFPFSHFEGNVLQHADAAIVGNRDARDVWQAKGFTGPIRIIPQFGVDPAIYAPRHLAARTPNGQGTRTATPRRAPPAAPFVIGYAGRLVLDKGVDILLRAIVELPPNIRIRIVGEGPERPRLERLAAHLNLAERVEFGPHIPSMQMPRFYAQLDCLVLASRTRPNWKEQFGRILIEAMACGVPVIGSTCGEIPNVVGDAGLTFPEEDVTALAARVLELQQSRGLRQRLAEKGRARVLAQYTHKRIAEETVAVYRSLVNESTERALTR